MKNFKEIINKFVKAIILLIFIVCTIYNIVYIIGHELNEEFNIKILGYQIIRTSDNPMKPEFSSKDLLIVKKADNFSKNDIIVFYKNKQLTIRRIVEEKTNNKYLTKGDNYFYIDPYEVADEEIEGIVIFKINNLGFIFKILQSKVLTFINTIVLIFLFRYNLKKKNRRMKKEQNIDKNI